MKESNFQQKFYEWIKDNQPELSAAYELKICKSSSIPFDSVKEHQIEKLRQVKQKGLYHKISDVPFGHANGFRFHKPKPFDCLFVRGDAWIVILFYKPRKKKEALFIDVDKFVEESKTVTRKSLTEARAREIADNIVFV
jgi:hypothetical protein